MAFLAVFAIVDLALIGLAVQHTRQAPPSDTIAAIEPGVDNGLSEQRTFDFKRAEAAYAFMSADGRLVTGVRGSCDKPGSVWTSLDDGATMTEVDSGVAEVLAVRSMGQEDLLVVGAGRSDDDSDACDYVQRRSTDAGKTWFDDPAITLWHLSADPDKEDVITPAGSNAPPTCQVMSVQQIRDDLGRATCTDGRIYATDNAGKTWKTFGRLDNLRAVTFRSETDGFALARYQGCASYAFTTVDGTTWDPRACIDTEVARAAAANDTTDFALVGNAETVWLSDDGKEWRQP